MRKKSSEMSDKKKKDNNDNPYNYMPEFDELDIQEHVKDINIPNVEDVVSRTKKENIKQVINTNEMICYVLQQLEDGFSDHKTINYDNKCSICC